MTAKILQCNCAHKFQDATYGKGMRVHTQKTPSSNVHKHVCTVCEKEK